MSHRVTESVVVNVNKNGLRGCTTAIKVKPIFHQNVNPFTFCWGFAFALLVGLDPKCERFPLWYRYQHVDIEQTLCTQREL